MIDDGYFNIEECPVDEDFIGLEDNEDEGDEESEDDFDKENMLPEENVFGENEDGEGMEIQTEKHRENSEGGDDEIVKEVIKIWNNHCSSTLARSEEKELE